MPSHICRHGRIRRTLLWLGCLALLLALRLPQATEGAGQTRLAVEGPATSYLQVVNLDPSEPADVAVDFYPQSGAPPIRLSRSAVAPMASAGFFLPA